MKMQAPSSAALRKRRHQLVRGLRITADIGMGAKVIQAANIAATVIAAAPDRSRGLASSPSVEPS
jgi:hypothetical protein